MRSRQNVVLAVLSSVAAIYQYVGVDDFRPESSGNERDDPVKPKSSFVNNTPKVSSYYTSKFFDSRQLQAGGLVIVDRKSNQHNASNQKQIMHDQTPTTAGSSGQRSTASKVIQAQSKSATTNKPPTCCLRPAIDVTTRLTPEFFEIQRTNGVDPKTNWTGTEYVEWLVVSEKLNPNHEHYTNLDCTTQYNLLVLEQASGYYLRCVLTELGTDGQADNFPYYAETPGLARILLLGDSISKEIRNQTQRRYHGLANIQGAPTNGLGFWRHKTGLQQWLGHCPWDLVQFNVGMHFRPKEPENFISWYDEYRKGIIMIVDEIRNHSPSAHIVFALTTPSPFDSNATMPKNNVTCPHYNKFHKAGFVPAMNKVVKSMAKELGIIINDRYSFIHPVLEKYQCECDVHFTEEGSRVMSEHDWKLFSALLSIKNKVAME